MVSLVGGACTCYSCVQIGMFVVLADDHRGLSKLVGHFETGLANKNFVTKSELLYCWRQQARQQCYAFYEVRHTAYVLSLATRSCVLALSLLVVSWAIVWGCSCARYVLV